MNQDSVDYKKRRKGSCRLFTRVRLLLKQITAFKYLVTKNHNILFMWDHLKLIKIAGLQKAALYYFPQTCGCSGE
jgi:hypothetical protein